MRRTCEFLVPFVMWKKLQDEIHQRLQTETQMGKQGFPLQKNEFEDSYQSEVSLKKPGNGSKKKNGILFSWLDSMELYSAYRDSLAIHNSEKSLGHQVESMVSAWEKLQVGREPAPVESCDRANPAGNGGLAFNDLSRS